MTAARTFPLDRADLCLQMEENVLSAVLLDGAPALARVRPILSAGQFDNVCNRHLYVAACALADRNEGVDPSTIAAELQRTGNLDRAGGMDYIGHLIGLVGGTANAETWARYVVNEATRRALKEHYEQALRLVDEGALSAREVVEQSASVLAGILPDFGRAGAIRILDDEDVESLPDPAWIVADAIPENANALIFGERGHYKTFVALDLSAHIATGMDWHGKAVQQGSVAYVYAEGRGAIKRRLRAWKEMHGVARVDIKFIAQRVVLNEPMECNALVAAIRQRFGKHPPRIIVIDTLARCSTGNENSAEDMGAYVRGVDTLREATGAAVLTVHHKGHGEAERYRGSSALGAAVDAEFSCTKDGDRVEIKCTKQKDGPDNWTLAWQVMDVAGSQALRPIGVADGGLAGNRLQILRALHDNSTDEGMTYKSWFTVSGVKAGSSFSSALNWLKTNSYVANEKGRWKVTGGGQLSLNSINSTGTPSPSNGVVSKSLHHAGGVYSTPAMELDVELVR